MHITKDLLVVSVLLLDEGIASLKILPLILIKVISIVLVELNMSLLIRNFSLITCLWIVSRHFNNTIGLFEINFVYFFYFATFVPPQPRIFFKICRMIDAGSGGTCVNFLYLIIFI